ncbi:MAG: sulfite exporter TauE/SafE family protein [Oscillospiraceae bacterium]
MASNFLIITAVATVLGILSGLGVGGGSLLLLWLTLIIGTDQETARMINLLFFLPSAAISCCFRWKQGTLCIKQILPAAIFGCIGAVLGTITTDIIPLDSLKKLFGILLIITGVRELLYKPKKQAS